MTNYEKVAQWATTLNADKALLEMEMLRLKYPWLKCEESFQFIKQMVEDLPKIAQIVKHQEKQNAIHRKFIEVSEIADKAIINAIESRFDL